MNLYIPKDWPEIDEKQFWELLENVNWKRDGYYNGETFEALGFEEPAIRKYANGAVVTEMIPRRVAIHTTDNRYFIDPEFFKPAV